MRFSKIAESFRFLCGLFIDFHMLSSIFSKGYFYKNTDINIKISKDSGKVCEKIENLLSSVSFLKYPIIFIHVRRS